MKTRLKSYTLDREYKTAQKQHIEGRQKNTKQFRDKLRRCKPVKAKVAANTKDNSG